MNIPQLINQEFRHKKVLVTGHTGFKGSWLSIWLNELGALVTGYSLDPKSDKDNFVLAGLENKITDIRGDIRDIDNLQRVFKKYKPDCVFHLAAQSLVKQSYLHPKETYDVNVGGTVNVLECCRNSESVKTIIIVTSDKCYENKEWIWGYRETDPVGGFDPYSSSKGAVELIISAYRNSFFHIQDKAISSVRAGNIIGGGDWSDFRIIPDCIRSLENNRSIEVRNPESIRPWQFILEPLAGYLFLSAKMQQEGQNLTGSWNFGPNPVSVQTVKYLVENIISCYGTGSWKNIEQKKQDHESRFLMLDINKAKFQLGWEPILSFEKAIGLTVDWYKKYQDTQVYDFCKAQIENYQQEIIDFYGAGN